MSNMKLGSTFAYDVPLKAPTLLRGTFEDCVTRSASLGFDYIEPQLFLNSENVPDWKYVRRLCDENHISVSAYATGTLYTKNGLSLIDDDESVVEEAIKRLQLYIEGAGITGGKVIIGCIRGNIDERHPYAEFEKRLAVAMRKVCANAKSAGVEMVLEVINRYENNYLNTAEEAVEFIEAYGLDGLQILLDTFHMNIEEADLLSGFSIVKKRLGHVHTADNTRNVPGMGTLPWVSIVRELEKIGYDGVLSFETRVARDENSEAATGLDYMRKVLKNI